MIINLTYDASVSGAPAGFQTTAQSVVDFFAAHFRVPVTVGVQMGWNTLTGAGLPGGVVGVSLSSATATTFSNLRTALGSNARSSNADKFVASLAGSDPTGGDAIVTSKCNHVVLGLSASGGVDGFCGFGSGNSYTFNTVSGGLVTPGTFDMWGVMAHEVSELLGRFRDGKALGAGQHYPLDLASYTAAATRAFAGTTGNSYFSVDGGITNLEFFNTNASFDFVDWAGAHVDCANAIGSTGTSQPWTAVDMTTMDILGYQAGPPFSTRMTWS